MNTLTKRIGVASSESYLEYVLDLLRDVPGVKSNMGNR